MTEEDKSLQTVTVILASVMTAGITDKNDCMLLSCILCTNVCAWF